MLNHAIFSAPLVRLGCGATSLLLAGCATQRVYSLPAKVAAQAEYAADPLIACATMRNFQAERDGYEVKVFFDDQTTARFSLDPYSSQTMAVSVDDRHLSPGQADKAFAEVRGKGEELYACATTPSAYTAEATDEGTGSRAEATSPEAALLMASSMGEISPMGDSCANLAACYADIATSVCHATDSACRSEYTLNDEMSANAGACHQTLSNIPNMVRALQAQRPAFVTPSSCTVDQQANVAPPAAATETSSYNGSWKASVDYSFTCGDDVDKVVEGKDHGEWTLSIRGGSDALAAEVAQAQGGYALSGSGDAQALRLCGAFPLRGQQQMTASPQVNNVCFIVEPRRAQAQAQGVGDVLVGRLEGAYYVGNQSCALQDAQVILKRQ